MSIGLKRAAEHPGETVSPLRLPIREVEGTTTYSDVFPVSSVTIQLKERMGYEISHIPQNILQFRLYGTGQPAW
jgi:hypothetical protein